MAPKDGVAPRGKDGPSGEEEREQQEHAAGSLLKLSPVGEVLRRATEAGSGVLSIGRPWVRHEGWLLKEGGLTSSFQARFFVVVGGKLEYYKEEAAKLNMKNVGDTPLGVVVGNSNVISKVEQVGLAQQQKSLLEGDVVISLNGETVVHQPLQPAVEKARRAGAPSLTFAVLRPKGKVNLAGANVVLGGARKAGGHLFTVNMADGAARRSRYSLAAANEREFLAWVTSIKEAIAAAQMEGIKTTIAQTLEEQNYKERVEAAELEREKVTERASPARPRAASSRASASTPAEMPPGVAPPRRSSNAADRTVAVL